MKRWVILIKIQGAFLLRDVDSIVIYLIFRPHTKANRAGTRGFRAPEVLLKCGDQSGGKYEVTLFIVFRCPDAGTSY